MKKLVNISILAALLGALLFLVVADRPSRDQIQSFQVQGDGIVAQIERHREASRQYPEPREVQLPEAPFGGWVYEPSADGSYRLWLGDYGDDGFTLSWNQEKGSWYIDT